MIPKNFDAITGDDVLALVTNQTPEGRTLDYKESLPDNISQAEQKKEFLADIAAFANASGGDIVFGIKERRDAGGKPTGLPEAVVGVGDENFDNLTLRMQSIIRDGLEPRIRGIQIKPIQDVQGHNVLLLRVPKSLQAPHMLAGRDSRFYVRTTVGKHPMDVAEIRAAFDFSRELTTSIRNFRADRIANILTGEAPVMLYGPGRAVLHVIPIASFASSINLNVKEVKHALNNLKLLTGGRGYTVSYNFDGLVSSAGPRDDSSESYLQLFRNGVIESVTSRLIYPSQDGPPRIAPFYEKAIAENLKPYVQFLQALDVPPPIVVAATLIGVKGAKMAIDTWRFANDTSPIRQDVLPMPEVILEDHEFVPGIALKPAFDTVWQASDWPHTPYFDAEGKWIGK